MYSAAATFAAMFVHYLYDCFQTDDPMGNIISITTVE